MKLKGFIEGLNKYLENKGISMWFGYQYGLLPQQFKVFKEYKLRVYQVDTSNGKPLPTVILEYSKILKIDNENQTDEIIDNEAADIIAILLDKLFKLSV